ncbi:hypothetical protein SLEP1_g10437 [Rubroshorea leprosula]|uniref:Uncharacterized protein n=1 Tax=Rubroshorea leprosula TaxID=152421 RepID=A0AAV5I833_9ROSI|nr:hypothetical protein SLEP1_g10437 [Rubroshorea leprosula]
MRNSPCRKDIPSINHTKKRKEKNQINCIFLNALPLHTKFNDTGHHQRQVVAGRRRRRGCKPFLVGAVSMSKINLKGNWSPREGGQSRRKGERKRLNLSTCASPTVMVLKACSVDCGVSYTGWRGIPRRGVLYTLWRTLVRWAYSTRDAMAALLL